MGQAKGRIEKIAVRALFLRHHRGAINVLPYGEIKQLRNTSRDWMIMVMEFRLAFDTDLKKVKKILKQIGGEIAADPELGPELLQPLKSQGVMSTDDSALVVRAKYMARPGNVPFMIRRVPTRRSSRRSQRTGSIRSRRVAVYVPSARRTTIEVRCSGCGGGGCCWRTPQTGRLSAAPAPGVTMVTSRLRFDPDRLVPRGEIVDVGVRKWFP